MRFLQKKSFSKGVNIRHEKICILNTLTKSCATCLCSSINSGISPFMCLLGVGAKLNNEKHEKKSNCSKWIHIDLIEYLDDYDHASGVLDDASRVLNLIARILKSETGLIFI